MTSTAPPFGAAPAWTGIKPVGTGIGETKPAKGKPADKPKLEPPDPVLAQHGYTGGIGSFNQRVQQVFDSYKAAYSAPPSPGLVFDVARSKVPDHQFQKLFSVPNNPQSAKARGIIVAQGGTPAPLDQPDLTVRDVTDGLLNAAGRGGYHDYLAQHEDVIHQMQKDPATAAKLNGALMQAQRLDEWHKTVSGGSAQPGLPSDLGNPNNLVSPEDRKYYADNALAIAGIVEPVTKSVTQITDALVHSPAGLYMVGKAAGLDTNDAIQHGNFSFTRTRTVAKASVKATVQDVEHPTENPGLLFLDALGFASLGAGTVARLGAAGRAAGEEAGALGKTGAAAKAFVRKPALQRTTVSYGGYTEEMPLNQNPLVAALQKGILKVRENQAEQGRGPLAQFMLPDALQDVLDEHLSIPKKLGRLADARKRVEYTAQTALQRDLDAVAGRSVMQARVLSRVPQKLRGGLTRGEQKAIQVLATDDPTPLETERAFHQRMIEQGIGDPKAHKRQIADLKLASKALDDPSERFQKALALTRQVVGETEQIKMQDLGLLPETAEGRVAKLGAVLRGEDIVRHPDEGGQFKQIRTTGPNGGELVDEAPLARVNDDSFYLQAQRRGKVQRPPSNRPGYYPTKAGPYGIPAGRDIPELTHEFTGKAIQAGDYRIDATSLASEGYGRTVRAATIRAEHAKLWEAATDKPRSRFDVPIRDSNTIPDKLRAVVARLDEGDFTPEDAKDLPPDMAQLIQELYPHPDRLTDEPIEGVKWVDARLLGEGNTLPHQPGLGAKVGDLVNAPFRFLALYAKPSYILNKLGNEAMLVWDQGVFSAAQNMIRAMNGEKLYGEENMRTIHALTGSGHARSLVNSNVSKVGQAVAEFWNVVADRDERSASFIYYANRLGYKSKDDFTRLLNSKESRADLVEATDRSNKALVQFDNLTPIEKNYIRHWVFVYPWVSRSAVWSIRAILEHPAKTAILADLGQQDIDDDPLNGKVVQWVKDAGYVPLGWDHLGNPKVVNPSSVNTFSTLGDFLALTRAATEGDKYASAEDFLGPLPKYLIHAVSGRDEYGNTYPGSQWYDAAKEVLQGLPQVAAYKRGSQTAAAKQPVFTSEGPQFYAKAYARNKQFATGGPYQTSLTEAQEQKFERWVKANNIPFDPAAKTVDYDMRGFWLANGSRAANGHFPDTFKTPYDTTFSAESKYATPDNPLKWQGNNLVDTRDGTLVFGTATTTSGNPVNVGSRDSIAASLNAGLKQTVLSPGWLDGYGSLLIGGLSDRTVNLDAAGARYWADQNPQVRHGRELDLLNRALDVQGEALKQPVPDGVRSAVKDQANITYAAALFQKSHGRAPTDKERANLTLAYLVSQGTLTGKAAAPLQSRLDSLVDPHDIALFKNALLDRYAFGKQLRSWDTDIRTVASFQPDIFNAKVAKLYAQGLSPQRRYNVDTPALEDYGRQYVAFTHEVKALQQQIKDGSKTAADLTAFQDSHDKPINGLPSFVRIAWTHLGPQEQQQHIVTATKSTWGDLTSFDKQLLGVKSDAKVTAGWAHLKDVIATQRAVLEKEGRSFPKGYARTLAKWVEKTYDAPGLTKDYDFSQEPLYRRLQVLKPITDSPEHAEWTKILSVANGYEKYIASGYTKTQVVQTWKDYVQSDGFQQWLSSEPAFKADVAQYGKGFLNGLLG